MIAIEDSEKSKNCDVYTTNLNKTHCSFGKNIVTYRKYQSIKTMNQFSLLPEHKQKLLFTARKTLDHYLKLSTNIKLHFAEEELNSHSGAFVSLHNGKELRGCIGRFVSKIPLFELVQEMAIAAATEDTRFNPVEYAELKNIRIEISVLSPLKQINSLSELTIGKHGIYIKKGHFTGTLLPQVATENNWDKQKFVEYCAAYKAQIGKDGWKNAELFTYEAIVFEE